MFGHRSHHMFENKVQQQLPSLMKRRGFLIKATATGRGQHPESAT
jgi:hypothetical protein